LSPISRPQLAQLGGRGRVEFYASGGSHRRKGLVLPLINAFGVDIQGGLRRAAFSGQAQGFGAEDGIVAPTFGRWGTVFPDVRKLRPYSVQIYLATSLNLFALCTALHGLG